MISKIRQLMEMAYSSRKYKLAAAIAMLAEYGWYHNNISDMEARILAEAEALIELERKWDKNRRLNKASKSAKSPQIAQKIINVAPAHADEAIMQKMPPKKAEKKRFVKPTVEQVADYCRERGNNVNAKHFVDFYEAKGWLIGRNPMKDWKAAVRTWEQRDRHDHRRDRRGATPAPQEQLKLSF